MQKLSDNFVVLLDNLIPHLRQHEDCITDHHQFSSAGKCLAYESFLVWRQQVREIQIKLDDEVTLPGWLIGVRHSLAWNGLLVTRAVSNSHNIRTYMHPCSMFANVLTFNAFLFSKVFFTFNKR